MFFFKVSPYQCMQVFYSIYYENDKSPICNFHSKRKPIENEEYQVDGIFTLNCFGKFKNKYKSTMSYTWVDFFN